MRKTVCTNTRSQLDHNRPQLIASIHVLDVFVSNPTPTAPQCDAIEAELKCDPCRAGQRGYSAIPHI